MQKDDKTHLWCVDDEFLKKHSGPYIEHTAVVQAMVPAVCSRMVLAYIAHGKGTFYEKSTSYDIYEDDIILINRGTQFRLRSAVPDAPLSFYICVFDPNSLPYSWKAITSAFNKPELFPDYSYGSLIVHDTVHNDVKHLMLHLLNEYSYTQPRHEMYIKCELVVTIITILRLYSAADKNKAPQYDNFITGFMCNYIKTNIYKKCSLTEIAEYMHMSPQYICKVFKDNMGMTFIEYCNHRRVEKIKKTLERTDRPLYMVYNDYDFSSRYLNKIFKEETGYSIKEYRDKFNYKADNPLYPK